MTSAILTKLANFCPEVLTNPEKYLGPNAPKVLKFWEHIDGLNDEERDKIVGIYFDLSLNVLESAWASARNVADAVVCWEIRDAAWYAAYDVTGWRQVFGYATWELIGGVENPIFYNLIMNHKNSSSV